MEEGEGEEEKVDHEGKAVETPTEAESKWLFVHGDHGFLGVVGVQNAGLWGERGYQGRPADAGRSMSRK